MNNSCKNVDHRNFEKGIIGNAEVEDASQMIDKRSLQHLNYLFREPVRISSVSWKTPYVIQNSFQDGGLQPEQSASCLLRIALR